MAPEQARGDVASIDQRTDIYALSAMLYEILTGQTPYSGDGPEEMMRAVQFDALVSPMELVAEVPKRLDEICCKGLMKNPDDRFQNASELSLAVEQWMAEEAIRRQSDQARQRLFEMSDDLMLIFDQQQRVTWANAAWKRVLGQDTEAMIGNMPMNWEGDEGSSDLSSDIEFWEQIARGNAVKGVRRRALTVDGKQRWFSWTATPVPGEGITIAIGRDINDLVNKSDELNAMLEVAPEAIVVINPDGSIHRINSQVTKMFGYEPDELIFRPIQTLIPSRFHKVFNRFFDRYVRKPSARPFLKRGGLQGQHKNGSLFKLGVRFSPVFLDTSFRIVCSIRRKADDGANRSPEVP
jgi:serine/threonine-protein kinase